MKISVKNLRDTSEGIVQGVDNSVVAQNSVYLASNFAFDKTAGRAEVRDGITQFGLQIVDGKSCLGLHMHVTTSGIKIPLAAFNAAGDATAVISKYTEGAWSSGKTGLSPDSSMRFLTFLDTTMMLNGVDRVSTFGGETWVTTGGNLDIANCPVGNLCMEFQDKVYVAGVSGDLDRIFFSSTPSAGAISWTVDNGYIDIEPEEGAGAISALAKVPGYFLIFKKRSFKRWDGSSTFPESLMTIGAPSQEAVVMTAQSVFYYSGKHGFYETIGGYPRKISRRIQHIIDAIPSSYYDQVSGIGDGERLYFSIGDITLDGLTLDNCVVVYKIDTQTWTLYSFPCEIKRWTIQIDNNDDEIIMAGDTDGNVWQVFEGTTDAGVEMNCILQTQPMEFGSRGLVKEISKVVAYSKRLKNFNLTCRVDETGDFKPVGTLASDSIDIVNDIKGRVFEFRLTGKAIAGNQFIGLDFPSVNATASYKE